MRQRLQLKWMLTASTVLATSFTLTVPSARSESGKAGASAAIEVREFYGPDSVQSANAQVLEASHGHQATPEQLDQSIVMAVARHDVDPNLVRAVIPVESNFNSNAVSRQGAMSLTQLMPKTAGELNLKRRFDPELNADAGVRQLKYLLEKYNGDVNLTVTPYKAGESAVERSRGVPHIAETQDYVGSTTHLYYSGCGLSQSGASRDPVYVQRDERGVLYISNTD